MSRHRKWPGLRWPPTPVNVSSVVQTQRSVQCLSYNWMSLAYLCHNYWTCIAICHIHTVYPGLTTRDSSHAIWQQCNRQGTVVTITVTQEPCRNRVFIQHRHIVPRDVAHRETFWTHCHIPCGIFNWHSVPRTRHIGRQSVVQNLILMSLALGRRCDVSIRRNCFNGVAIILMPPFRSFIN